MNNSWWPASGYRSNGSAVFNSLGHGGYYWSSSRHTTTAHSAFNLGFYYDGNVGPSNNDYRSNGFSYPLRVCTLLCSFGCFAPCCIEDPDK